MTLLPVAELNSRIEPVHKRNASKKQSDGSQFQPWQQHYLLQAVVEAFIDGILILTDQGELVHANTQAHQIGYQLVQSTSQPSAVVQEIWRVCESLRESYELFPDRKIIIESEVTTETSATYRIRARWLELGESECRFLLVTLEARYQDMENLAIADINKYDLTPREAEVWLLRQTKHSYKEIAAKLYITINTVKKHLKNIYAKQQEYLQTWDTPDAKSGRWRFVQTVRADN
jgi:DNA-binding CsgD family transcriptional regulator